MEKQLLIGQAAEILQCNKSLLRYYESEFSLSIPRDHLGRRYYTSKELEMFRYIYKLKEDGNRNEQIKAVLNSQRITGNIYTFSPTDECIENEKPKEDILLLYQLIEKLREEISDIKQLNNFDEKTQLIRENSELKKKLKEKTYELVEAREKLSNIKKATSKKLFKNI